jgi:hypothetical protein
MDAGNRSIPNLRISSFVAMIEATLDMRFLLFLALFSSPLLFLSCSNAVLFDERFFDARLTNWTVIDDPDTVEIPSDWHVEADDWLHQRSNIWGRRGDFLGRWYGTFLVAGDEAWDDYRVSVKAKPSDNDGFGVVFRFNDAQHFYRLLFINDGFSGGPLTRLDKRKGDDYTEIWSNPQGFVTGKELFIEIDVQGDTMRAWVDGKQLFDAKDGDYRRGKIGLFCYAQSDQAFDNVRVVRP